MDNTQAINDWAEAAQTISAASVDGLLENVPEHLKDNPEVIKAALEAAGNVASTILGGEVIKPAKPAGLR